MSEDTAVLAIRRFYATGWPGSYERDQWVVRSDAYLDPMGVVACLTPLWSVAVEARGWPLTNVLREVHQYLNWSSRHATAVSYIE